MVGQWFYYFLTYALSMFVSVFMLLLNACYFKLLQMIKTYKYSNPMVLLVQSNCTRDWIYLNCNYNLLFTDKYWQLWVFDNHHSDKVFIEDHAFLRVDGSRQHFLHFLLGEWFSCEHRQNTCRSHIIVIEWFSKSFGKLTVTITVHLRYSTSYERNFKWHGQFPTHSETTLKTST